MVVVVLGRTGDFTKWWYMYVVAVLYVVYVVYVVVAVVYNYSMNTSQYLPTYLPTTYVGGDGARL